MEKYSLLSTDIYRLLNPTYSYEKKGFQGWELSKNSQEISRLKKRIESLEKASGDQTNEWQREGVSIVDNVEANRLQIYFASKPSEEIRTLLKGSGFRWSPSQGCWQRFRSQAATNRANQIVDVYAMTLAA